MTFLRALDNSTLWLIGAVGFLVASVGFAGQALVRLGPAVFSLPTLNQVRPYWWVFWGFLIGTVGWGLQLAAFFRGGLELSQGEPEQAHWSNRVVAITGVLTALISLGVLGLEVALRYA